MKIPFIKLKDKIASIRGHFSLEQIKRGGLFATVNEESGDLEILGETVDGDITTFVINEETAKDFELGFSIKYKDGSKSPQSKYRLKKENDEWGLEEIK